MRVLAGLLGIFVGTVTASAQVTRPGGPPVRDTRPVMGRSTIRGRILTEEGGRPVRRAEVRVAGAELRVPRRTLTDADGRFEFRDLPAGNFSVTATKTAFVTSTYGQSQPGALGKPV